MTKEHITPPPPPHFHPNHLVRLSELDDFGTKGQSQISDVSLHLYT